MDFLAQCFPRCQRKKSNELTEKNVARRWPKVWPKDMAIFWRKRRSLLMGSHGFTGVQFDTIDVGKLGNYIRKMLENILKLFEKLGNWQIDLNMIDHSDHKSSTFHGTSWDGNFHMPLFRWSFAGDLWLDLAPQHQFVTCLGSTWLIFTQDVLPETAFGFSSLDVQIGNHPFWVAKKVTFYLWATYEPSLDVLGKLAKFHGSWSIFYT